MGVFLFEFCRIILGHIAGNPAFQPSVSRDSSFATTSEGFLSSRMPTKVQCLRCPASVHSRKATWQTSLGLTHRHSCIFSAVNDSPHREALFSGRFLNGHWAVCSALRAPEDLVPKSRDEAVLHLRNKDELFILVNAHEQRIESAGARDIPADDEFLFHVRAVLDPSP